jgi:hypothetical protein
LCCKTITSSVSLKGLDVVFDGFDGFKLLLLGKVIIEPSAVIVIVGISNFCLEDNNDNTLFNDKFCIVLLGLIELVD